MNLKKNRGRSHGRRDAGLLRPRDGRGERETTSTSTGSRLGDSGGTVNLRSCGRSANRISLIRHTRPGESRRQAKPAKIALGLLKLTDSFSALLVRLLAPPSFGLFDGVDGEGFELGGQLAEAAGVVEPVPVTVELLRG